MPRITRMRAPPPEVQDSFPESVLSEASPEEIQTHRETSELDSEMIQSQLQRQLVEEDDYDPEVTSILNALSKSTSPPKNQTAITATRDNQYIVDSTSPSEISAGGGRSVHMRSSSALVENSDMNGSKTLLTSSARRKQLRRPSGLRDEELFMDTAPDFPKSDPYELQESPERAVKEPATSTKRTRKSMEAADDSDDYEVVVKIPMGKRPRRGETVPEPAARRAPPKKMPAKRTKQKPLTRSTATTKKDSAMKPDDNKLNTKTGRGNEVLEKSATATKVKTRSRKDETTEPDNIPHEEIAPSSPVQPRSRPVQKEALPSSPPIKQNVQVVIPSTPLAPIQTSPPASSSPVVRRSPRNHFKEAPTENLDLSQNPIGSSGKVLEHLTKSRPKTVSPDLQQDIIQSSSASRARRSFNKRIEVSETPQKGDRRTVEALDDDQLSETDLAARAAMGLSQSLLEDLENDEYMQQLESDRSIPSIEVEHQGEPMVMDEAFDEEMAEVDIARREQGNFEGITDILMNPSPVKPPSQKLHMRRNDADRPVEPRAYTTRGMKKKEETRTLVLSEHPTMKQYEEHFVKSTQKHNHRPLSLAERKTIKQNLKEQQKLLRPLTKDEWDQVFEHNFRCTHPTWAPSYFMLWAMSSSSFAFLRGPEKFQDLRSIIAKNDRNAKRSNGISFAKTIRRVSKELIQDYDLMHCEFIHAMTKRKADSKALDKAQALHRDVYDNVDDLTMHTDLMNAAIVDPVDSQIWDNYEGYEADEVRTSLLKELYTSVVWDMAKAFLAAMDCYCFERTPNRRNLSELQTLAVAALQLIDTAREHDWLLSDMLKKAPEGLEENVDELFDCLQNLCLCIEAVETEVDELQNYWASEEAKHESEAEDELDEQLTMPDVPGPRATRSSVKEQRSAPIAKETQAPVSVNPLAQQRASKRTSVSKPPQQSFEDEGPLALFDDESDVYEEEAESEDESDNEDLVEPEDPAIELARQKAAKKAKQEAARRKEEERLAKLKAFEEEGRRIAERKAKMYPGSQSAPPQTQTSSFPARRNASATRRQSEDPFATDISGRRVLGNKNGNAYAAPQRQAAIIALAKANAKPKQKPGLMKQIAKRPVVRAADPTYVDGDAMLVDDHNYADDDGSAFADVDLDELHRIEAEKIERRRARAAREEEARQVENEQDGHEDEIVVEGEDVPIERVHMFETPKKHSPKPRPWTKEDALRLIECLKSVEVYDFDDLARILKRDFYDVAQKTIELKPVWASAYSERKLKVPEWISDLPDSLADIEDGDDMEEDLPDVEEVRRQSKLERQRETVRRAVRNAL